MKYIKIIVLLMASLFVTSLQAATPVKIDVFEDFQCPTCGWFYENAEAPVIAHYAGRVDVVHHDFPLPQHAHALEAARLYRAACAVGKGAQVEKALFETQAEWGAKGDVNACVSRTVPLAKILHYEKGHQSRIDAGIHDDIVDGIHRGLRGTPTIFVTADGKTEALPNVPPYSLLSQYLDYLLRGK